MLEMSTILLLFLICIFFFVILFQTKNRSKCKIKNKYIGKISNENYINKAQKLLSDLSSNSDDLVSIARDYVNKRSKYEDEVSINVKNAEYILSLVLSNQSSTSDIVNKLTESSVLSIITKDLSSATNASLFAKENYEIVKNALYNIINLVNDLNITMSPSLNPKDISKALNIIEIQQNIAKDAYVSVQKKLNNIGSAYSISKNALEDIEKNLNKSNNDLSILNEYISSLTNNIQKTDNYSRLKTAVESANILLEELKKLNLDRSNTYFSVIDNLKNKLSSSIKTSQDYLDNIIKIFNSATDDASITLKTNIKKLEDIYVEIKSLIGSLDSSYSQSVDNSISISDYYQEVLDINSNILKEYNLIIGYSNEIIKAINDIQDITYEISKNINTNLKKFYDSNELDNLQNILQQYFPSSTRPPLEIPELSLLDNPSPIPIPFITTIAPITTRKPISSEDDQYSIYLKNLAFTLNNINNAPQTPISNDYSYNFGIVQTPIVNSTILNNQILILINGLFTDPLNMNNHILSGDNTGGFFPRINTSSIGNLDCPSNVTNNGINYTISNVNGSCYVNTKQRQGGSTPFCEYHSVNGVCYRCDDPENATCLQQIPPVCPENQTLCSDGLCYAVCDNGYNSSMVCSVCNPDIGDNQNMFLSSSERILCDINSANMFRTGKCWSYKILDSSSSILSGNNTQVFENNGLLYDSNYNIPCKGYSNVLYLSDIGERNLPYIQCGPFNINVSQFNIDLLASGSVYQINITFTSVQIIFNKLLLKLKPVWNNIRFDLFANGTNVVLSFNDVKIMPVSNTPEYILLHSFADNTGIYIPNPSTTSNVTINLKLLQLACCSIIISAIELLQNLSVLNIPIIGSIFNDFANFVLDDDLFTKTMNFDPFTLFVSSQIFPQIKLNITNVQEDLQIIGWNSEGPMSILFNNIFNMQLLDQLTSIQNINASNNMFDVLSEIFNDINRAPLLYQNLGIEIPSYVYTPITVNTNVIEKMQNLLSTINSTITTINYSILDNIMLIFLPSILNVIGINSQIEQRLQNINNSGSWMPMIVTPNSLPFTTPINTPISKTTPYSPTIILSENTEFLMESNVISFSISSQFNTVMFYCWGAGGGSPVDTMSFGGNGAFISGEFSIKPTDIISISVGQGGFLGIPGMNFSPYGGGGIGFNYGGSGGGCSCILLNNKIIVVSGGGGGAALNSIYRANGGYGSTLIDIIGGNGSFSSAGGAGALLSPQNINQLGIPDGVPGENSFGIINIGNMGVVGQGGNGGTGNQNNSVLYNGGGGGGGGYIGGGGGASMLSNFGAGGGGGGCSFIDRSIVNILYQSMNGIIGTSFDFPIKTISPGRGSGIGGIGSDGCIYIQLKNN
jgi:hypothetical protein